MRKFSIVGSHGYRASYGGWDALVNNLVDLRSEGGETLVFNPRETPVTLPGNQSDATVIQLPLSASGIQGLVYDSVSIILSAFKGFNILMLGMGAMPVMTAVKIMFLGKPYVVVNVGGIEWERPQFGRLARAYLKLCFWLARKTADVIILDNDHYLKFIENHERDRAKVAVIPYGGDIDYSIDKPTNAMIERFPFLGKNYFLSISRSIEDNKIRELCREFVGVDDSDLVVCSNFSASEYGRSILHEYSGHQNIYLVDGLYEKPVIDYLRRNCTAYIHTHTLCGSAPSLIEIIVAARPVIAIDVPQNRFTLANSGGYFSDFSQLLPLLRSGPIDRFLPKPGLAASYAWTDIVRRYEDCFLK
ncbi:DUF1972 domain-containing protein [Nostoc sp. CHAB 5824]|nr:DUF1972 domain-containing protein [Nostoc sp. CHAB 5824]